MIVVLKQGIITIKEGYELVWGIGLYGEHEYIVEYRVTESIKQIDDVQIIYWYFVIHGFLSGVFRGVNKMKKVEESSDEI